MKLIRDVEVACSNPVSPTNRNNDLGRFYERPFSLDSATVLQKRFDRRARASPAGRRAVSIPHTRLHGASPMPLERALRDPARIPTQTCTDALLEALRAAAAAGAAKAADVATTASINALSLR